VFAVDADDEAQVVMQPFVGTFSFVAFQFGKECLWFLGRHLSNVTLPCDSA
jgi:hypothetical protein